MSSNAVISERAVMARRLSREGLGTTAIAGMVGLDLRAHDGASARKQVIRWLTPLTDLGASRLIKRLAGQGKSQRQVRRLTGLGYVRFKRLVEAMPGLQWADPQPPQPQLDLTEQILALAEQDLSMRQAAKVMGINREKFRLLVAGMENNPWGPREVAALWEEISGETVVQTAQRMARDHTVAEVARAVGYADCAGLKKHLRVAGVEIAFRKRAR